MDRVVTSGAGVYKGVHHFFQLATADPHEAGDDDKGDGSHSRICVANDSQPSNQYASTMKGTRLPALLLALGLAMVTGADFGALDRRADAKAATVTPAVAATGGAGGAKQFHLSLASSSAKLSHYTLDWVTPAGATSSQLVYGTSADALTSRVDAKLAGVVDEGGDKSVACWSAVVKNLAPGTTIYYALANDADTTSKPRSFTVPSSSSSFTWAVFGDLGAPMQKAASGVSLPALKNALEADKAYQGVLNIGDLGYELVGPNGKNYMEELESITSKVPMQTTVGNVRCCT